MHKEKCSYAERGVIYCKLAMDSDATAALNSQNPFRKEGKGISQLVSFVLV